MQQSTGLGWPFTQHKSPQMNTDISKLFCYEPKERVAEEGRREPEGRRGDGRREKLNPDMSSSTMKGG